MDELRFDLQLFADDGGDNPNAGGNDGGQETGDGGQGHAGTTPTDGGKTFTQAELDAIIAKRLARERKAWEQQLEEERRKAAMTEAERLRAEKEEAERRAQEAQQQAAQRLVQAEAKVVAMELGVKPDRIPYVLRLADLSSVDVDENGQVDATALRAAIEAVLRDVPELKGATAAPGKSGADFTGGSGAAERNPWSKEHWNLTEQGRIFRENPELARRLMKEAKGR